MANNTLTLIGRLAGDPELRFTPSGSAVCNFTVVQQDRRLNSQTNQWEDVGEPLFQRCSAWRQVAESIGDSNLTKGMEVFVTGKLGQRLYETKEGEKRTAFELDVQGFGPTITGRQVVNVRKVEKGQQPQQQGGGGYGGGQQGGYGGGGGRPDDPWAGSTGGGYGGGGYGQQ